MSPSSRVTAPPASAIAVRSPTAASGADSTMTVTSDGRDGPAARPTGATGRTKKTVVRASAARRRFFFSSSQLTERRTVIAPRLQPTPPRGGRPPQNVTVTLIVANSHYVCLLDE